MFVTIRAFASITKLLILGSRASNRLAAKWFRFCTADQIPQPKASPRREKNHARVLQLTFHKNRLSSANWLETPWIIRFSCSSANSSDSVGRLTNINPHFEHEPAPTGRSVLHSGHLLVIRKSI